MGNLINENRMEDKYKRFDHWKGYEIDFSGINKTVFLTREEAEAALEKMKDGDR